MRFVLFCHSLRSDWNHGNAHFLRGVATELLGRGHQVVVYEPEDSWSAASLVRDHGAAALEAWRTCYPHIDNRTWRPDTLDLGRALDGADVVLVHEWNDPALVARLGRARAGRRDFNLLFHDTHHRAASDPQAMVRFDLSHYDGTLAFGRVIRDLYLERGWTAAAWTWHEAADVRVFRPLTGVEPQGELVWVGNWGDDEGVRELEEYLIGPVRELALHALVHGVRYPDRARDALQAAGIRYAGWLPNHEVPRVFAAHRITVHVPRGPYAAALPGIPTIRVFEALACGIPLVSAPWDDAERLFTPGMDYAVARDGRQMREWLHFLLEEPDLARAMAAHGLATVRARHTCAHRVDELLAIVERLGTRLPDVRTRTLGAAIGARP